jgi:hypothetical protein
MENQLQKKTIFEQQKEIQILQTKQDEKQKEMEELKK